MYDVATDKISLLSDRVVNIITGILEKMFKSKKSKIKEDDLDE